MTAIKTTRKTVRKPVVRTSVAKARAKKTPQDTAAQAVSTALADVARVVLVQFPNNCQQYSYYTRDPSVTVGDFYVVISPFTDRYGFHDERLAGFPSIVRVMSIKETVQSVNLASKWLVSKVDVTAAIEEAEQRERIAVLTAKIKKARKAAEERVKLEQLRELSPELDGLLTELDQLTAR